MAGTSWEQFSWAGMVFGCMASRASDIIEAYGDDRIMVNSAGDWGPSNPIAVPDFIQELRRRGHPDSKIKKIVYDNPLEFFRQCKRFEFTPPDTLADATPAEENVPAK